MKRDKMKKVFVSGCFDLLHSGHIRFLEEAARLGALYVSVGSDKTIAELKHRKTVYNEKERQYMVSSLKFVKKCFIGSGSGYLDFLPELNQVKPDIFFVNTDGDSPEKREYMAAHNIQYIVQKRAPKKGLPKRSTTELRQSLSK